MRQGGYLWRSTSVIGGLGAAVCETLSRKAPTPVKTIGIQDCFGESGPAVALLKNTDLMVFQNPGYV